MQKRNILARIFISPEEPRLRAGWRLVLQTIFMIIISIGLGMGLLLLPSLFSKIGDQMLITQIAQLIAFTLSIYLARRLLDRRSFVSLGLKLDKRAGIDTLTGIGIAGLMMAGIFALESAFGWITLEGFAWDYMSTSAVLRNALGVLLVFILVGWNEELLSRGYHLQTLASGINLTWGIIISSAVFGILHLGNPNATWVSAAGIFLAGVFLAYGYVRTGQLWLSIGLHIGWNYFEGVVFGFPVSGLDIFNLTYITVDGPILITGGTFGPEAGLIVIPGLIFGAALIYLYTRNSNTGLKVKS
ncbi:MAG: CPBP family intramembrane metalloprotease [Chloroflexi bacterium]|jgi:uncharacterized protein|nr:CPBP family intramembrane metalloprotease [Chloroflexota bacterium]